MYLKQALEQSNEVKLAGTCGVFYWLRDDYRVTLQQAISDQWSPVLPEVTFKEAHAKWKRFRRRSWPNKQYYWTLDVTNAIDDGSGDKATVRLEHLDATDWEEYTGV